MGDGDEQYRLVAFEMSDVNYEGFLEFSNPLFADQSPMQQAWDQLQTLLIQFEKPTESGIRTSLFIYSSRLSSDFEFTFRVDPTKDPRWQQFQDNLNQNILIYNDGFNEVYSAGDVGS